MSRGNLWKFSRLAVRLMGGVTSGKRSTAEFKAEAVRQVNERGRPVSASKLFGSDCYSRPNVFNAKL